MSKISLRPITYDDTDLIVKWRNSPDVKKNFFYREEFTKESHEKWMREQVEKGHVAQFIILKDGKPIGSNFLRDLDLEKGIGEYGVFIGDSESWGKGYGTEAMKQVLEYAFGSLGLNNVKVTVMSGNDISLHHVMRLGCKISKIVKNEKCTDGELRDKLLMFVTKEDFFSKVAAT